MLTKVIYALIDYLAILDLIIIYRASKRIKQEYGRLLRKAFLFGIGSIAANVLIAVSMNSEFAQVAYCFYFASIDWVLLYLTGFCLSYTEHEKALKKLRIPAVLIMAVDSVSIMCNLIFGHHFSIYENTSVAGTVFYQTAFKPAYYIHLAVDYIAVVITLFFIVYRIVKSYDLYRLKYVMILGVLLLVVVLNLIYMAFSLVLDISVVFYAVAGTLIYFCITRFVPRKLMNDSISMAVDDMKEGLVLFDVGNECIYANAFFKSRFGQTEESISYSSEPCLSVINSLKEKGEEFGKTEYINTVEDDEGQKKEEHYQIRYNRLKDKKGRKIGTYLLVEDDTEEMSYLKQISDARNEADEANRAKSIFLANMSHEIRTPLNAVLGMNEMILRETDDAQLTGYAENIRSAGTALLQLINEILDFSKIEARKTELKPIEYSIHKIIRDLYARFEKMAEEKALKLDVDCDPKLPSKLLGDERYIIQTVSNLISNAIKYTRKGSVSVFAEPDKNEAGEFMLRFTVTDTGIGIDEKDIPFIFDSFRRLNEKENATIQGTGLGLAITKELVELMDGTIRAESELGKGSSFILSIPQKIADKTPCGPFNRNIVGERISYHESFRAPEADILIVDDVEVNIIVISELLKKTNIRIDTASGGDEAIEKCRNRRYDLILLDHRMPQKDGIDTFREISSEGQNTDTPVIMLTANAMSGAREEYRKIGFADYLTKPVDSRELENMLIKYLPRQKVILN